MIKRFLVPFFATFLVVLFVLVILTLWQQFDKFAGKGLSAGIIMKYLGYTTLMVVPQALPIGILLSSIMAMGNLSENYEFAAIKSAGVSLYRLLKPLTIFMIVLSSLNFLFLNYVFPKAYYESVNLIRSIRKKQPAMALVAGSFNTDIPGFSIKFSEKYGEKGNLLKEVLIYDLRDKKYNNVSITAKHGEIKSENNSKYMTLVLKDGYYYKDIIPKRYRSLRNDNMPFIKSHFDEHQINFDISSLDKLDDSNKINELKMMLSLKQLKEKIIKEKKPYAKIKENTRNKYYNDVKANRLYKDTLAGDFKIASILTDFSDKNKIKILKNASSNLEYTLANLKAVRDRFKNRELKINKYDVEYYNRIAFSLACLVLFLIGAPLGSIIKKGGFGVPMITAIVIFVLYHFVGVFARGMADTGEIPPIIGGWFSTILMLPLGLFLIYRAVRDKGLFDVNTTIVQPIIKLFSKKEISS